MREWSVARTAIDEGYEQYAKQGKACVLPAMAWPDVALPPSLNSWLISQPDSVLSTIKAQDEALALNHLAHGPDNASIHDFSIITRDLTRRMTNLLPDVLDEVRASFDESISTTSSDGQDVQLYTLLENASRRAGNRMFIGVPFCRNEAVMQRLHFAGLSFSGCALLIRTFVPEFFRPVFAPLLGLPYYYQRWRLTRLFLPTIRQRMHAV